MENEYPRAVEMPNSGLYYSEQGPNSVYMNVILAKTDLGEQEIRLVFTIDQSEIGNQFQALLHGQLLTSIKLMDAFANAMVLDEQNIEDENEY